MTISQVRRFRKAQMPESFIDENGDLLVRYYWSQRQALLFLLGYLGLLIGVAYIGYFLVTWLWF